MESAPSTEQPLWRPHADQISQSNLARFCQWLRERRSLDLKDHRSLYDWSVGDLEGFWSAIAEFFAVRFHTPAERVLQRDEDPIHTKWFPGGTLNYTEHLLRFGSPEIGRSDHRPAAIFCTEPGVPGNRQILTRTGLVAQVGQLASALSRLGVVRGDRVAGYLPNRFETLIAFLATASLGAIWSNGPPELSSRGVVDRFAQIEPKVLVAVSNYRYGGKSYDRAAAVAKITANLPALRHLIIVEQAPDEKMLECGLGISAWRWSDLIAQQEPEAPLHFDPVPFDHPLWILYSSGTTGTPKPIIHGHGGILLEHLKALSFHLDLGPGDKFFWFTTAGWMMWNFLVSGLALGALPVLYDGSPKYPDLLALWSLIEREEINYFGTSAPFLAACQKESLDPRKEFRLRALRSIGSTGAPLSRNGFEWVYDKVSPNVWLGSVSGGTDVCTAFVLSHPWLPVYAGKLQCRGLGAPIEAWDEIGDAVWNQVGELVLTAPMPCMPVGFWNDPDGSRFRQAYFHHFPGTWRHGDWIEIDPDSGQCVIYGRSDSTLNRGGVRMGTSEFYQVVESFPEILASLVIDTTGLGPAGEETPGRLLLFIVLRETVGFDDFLAKRIRERIKIELSPRYVPDGIFHVPEIPQTLNGKKLEIPVKRIFLGIELSKSVSREAMSNPDSLKPFLELAQRYRQELNPAGDLTRNR
jgi:acetoacetyl-CoA synthetase